MVNILPQDKQQSLYRGYYFRLAGAFFFAAAILVVIGAGLLAPSYFLIQEETASAIRFRDAVVETLELKGTNTASRTVSSLSEEVKLLNAHGNTDTAMRVLRPILAARNGDVALKKIGFSFQHATGGEVSVTGVAETRAALVEYVTALQKETFFAGVTVPVSNLAADTDISFALSFEFKTP